MAYKRPVSILAVIHTSEDGETPIETACREVAEETDIVAPPEAFLDWRTVNTFEIFAEWRSRYAPGVTRNTEHIFSLELPREQPVRLAPGEHLAYVWLPWREAAEKCFSWSNRDAILMLPEKRAR